MGVKILDFDELERIRDRGLHEGIGALIADARFTTNVGQQLRDDLLRVADDFPALIDTAQQGRAFYAVALKYGLKHKQGCPLTSEADVVTDPCNCGLVADIQAVMNSKRE